MSVSPLVLNNFIPSEGFKIIVWIPVLGPDGEDNGVTHIFEAQDDVLEFIMVFEYRQPSIYIHKNVQR